MAITERETASVAVGSCGFCGCRFRGSRDVMNHRCAAMQEAAETASVQGQRIDPLTYRLLAEIARQDEKHGPFEGTLMGRSRLALACLEDEVAEAMEAWRSERKKMHWDATREEVLQVAAVAMRALRDAL